MFTIAYILVNPKLQLIPNLTTCAKLWSKYHACLAKRFSCSMLAKNIVYRPDTWEASYYVLVLDVLLCHVSERNRPISSKQHNPYLIESSQDLETSIDFRPLACGTSGLVQWTLRWVCCCVIRCQMMGLDTPFWGPDPSAGHAPF